MIAGLLAARLGNEDSLTVSWIDEAGAVSLIRARMPCALTKIHVACNHVVSYQLCMPRGFGTQVGASTERQGPVERSFIEAPPNVVSENGLRNLLQDGWQVEIVCRRDAEKRSYNWHGEWTVRGISPDGLQEKILITARNELEFRVLKTANGVISFMLDMGFEHIHLPLFEGGRCRQALRDAKGVASHRAD